MSTVLVDTRDRRSPRPPILGVLVILLALVLSACGAKIQTSLTIDGDGAGSRVMVLSAEMDSETTDNINGGAEEIDASIQAHLPEELEYSGMTVQGENISATFTLSFDSIEDYQDKASALLAESGIDNQAEINFVNTDEALISGVGLEENFTSENLLGWLAEGLVVDGIVAESDQSSVFDTSEISKVTIDGNDYAVDYEPISVSEVTENAFDYIGIFLDATSGSGYDVTVQYGLDEVPSGPVKEVQDAFLDDATVAGGELTDMSSDDEDDLFVDAGYTMTFHSDDEAALESDLGQALGTEDVTFTATTLEPAGDSLMYSVNISGSVDLYSVTNSGSYGEIVLTVPGSWVDDEFGGDGFIDENGNVVFRGDIDGLSAVIDVSFDRGIRVSDMSATLDVGMNQEVTQTYAFTVDPEDAAAFDEAIKQALGGSNSQLEVTTTESDNAQDADDEASGQSGTQSGAQSGSAQATTYTLVASDDQSVEGVSAYVSERPDGSYTVNWTGDVSTLLPGASIQKGTATVNLGFLNSFVSENQSNNPLRWSVEKGSATKHMEAPDFNLDFGQQAKGWKLGSFIGLCVGLGLLLVVIIVLLVLRKKIARLFKSKPKQAPVGYQPDYGQPLAPGNDLPESALFADPGSVPPGSVPPGAGPVSHAQPGPQPGPVQTGPHPGPQPVPAQYPPTGQPSPMAQPRPTAYPPTQTGPAQQVPPQQRPPQQGANPAAPAAGPAQASYGDRSQQTQQQPADPSKQQRSGDDFDEFNLM